MLKTIILFLSVVAYPLSSVSVASQGASVQLESIIAARTVTTIVQADSSGEAIVKAQNSYPKGKVISVRKTGGAKSRSWTVKLRIE